MDEITGQNSSPASDRGEGFGGCLEAEVYIAGRMAMITTRDGKRAVVPLRILCDIAKRFRICYKNYRC
ncbi:MAG: hypothetical protein ACO2O0_06085 [Desulfurococcales archaeon]